ncbi:MAG: hypothetical protein ACFB22_13600 [Rhodothalassiaceae bacterium]
MKIRDLKSVIEENEIPSWYFSIGETGNDQSTDLVFENGNWIIYTNERGKKEE